MRILVLIHEYPPIGGGGGRVAEDINRGLAGQGHQICVLTSRMKGLPGDALEGDIRIMRVPCLRRQPYRASLISMAAYLLMGLAAARRLLRSWRPDLIHVHFAVPAGLLAWALHRMTGIPYVLTAHLGDVPGGVPEKTGGWFRWVYPFTHAIWRDAGQVIAVSEFTRQLALQHYAVDIRVIPNGVDLQNIRPAEKKAAGSPRVIFAGRFSEQKNPIQIICSLAEVKDLPWACVMMGDGSLMDEVKREIETAGLQKRFTLTGWISPQEVLDWLDRGDILFMPSLAEGLPVVGVQALAKGLAFVVSRIGGFLDLVEDGGNGFLVEGSAPSGYSLALRKLLEDRSRLGQFKEASRARAALFDINRVVGKYAEIFRNEVNAR